MELILNLWSLKKSIVVCKLKSHKTLHTYPLVSARGGVGDVVFRYTENIPFLPMLSILLKFMVSQFFFQSFSMGGRGGGGGGPKKKKKKPKTNQNNSEYGHFWRSVSERYSLPIHCQENRIYCLSCQESEEMVITIHIVST